MNLTEVLKSARRLFNVGKHSLFSDSEERTLFFERHFQVVNYRQSFCSKH